MRSLSGVPEWEYPDLPVSRRREEIVAAMRESRVVVVVGETGSGKTTQLPKMALELAREEGRIGRIGCTQPRRLAATSVAKRVAEEMGSEVGGLVGYQVRFSEEISEQTAIKFMTDGILLAESQSDRSLRQYDTIIIDEAHERSLNIDFLLGFLHQLLEKRDDLRVVISSATLDAGRFAEFFDGAPVVLVEGRTYPVEDYFLPPEGDEELTQHVARAVEWVSDLDDRGDLLVFLPGEREIREGAKLLEGRQYPGTEVLQVFARLSLGEQQRVFHRGRNRRIVLATNVAETSLTIPGIVYVIDSGLARVSRYNPGRQVQRLQVEQISQASARQRRGRCGRLRDGVCVKLYSERDLEAASEFTDPEIRRSSLAGVILRLKALRFGDVREFPFLDPPSPRAVTEGFRTLEELGALRARDEELTERGRKLARLPLDPRLGRMVLEGRTRRVLGEVTIIVAGLSVMDPRERPSEQQEAADTAHAKFDHPDSDFLTYLNLWHRLQEFRKERRGWHRNRLRRFCTANFLNMRRVLEWDQVADELGRLVKEEYGRRPRALGDDPQQWGHPDEIHKSLLAGMPRQIGMWEKEKEKEKRYYRGTGGRNFAVFPGSGLFGRKRPEWVLGFDLVETSKLWARKLASIEPAWVEELAPQLCRSRFHSPRWNEEEGAVHGKETVICGGLTIVPERRVHFGRVDPKAAHEVFVREAVLGGGLRSPCAFLDRLEEVREEARRAEHKLRRVGGLWSEEAAYDFYFARIPAGIATAKAFHDWRRDGRNDEKLHIRLADVVWEEVGGELALFPDEVAHDGQTYVIAYRSDVEAPDDGVCFEIPIEQLATFPPHLLSWAVPGILEERIELLVRSLPKWQRQACFPIADAVRAFLDDWRDWEPDRELTAALAEFLAERSGNVITAEDFAPGRLPAHLRPKLRVYDDRGEPLALGEDARETVDRLAGVLRERREEAANLEWEMTGGEVWSFGEIPEEADGVFPALVDEGESVGMRAFLDREEAAESHRAGCVRLLLLEHHEHAEYVRKHLPLGATTRLYAPILSSEGSWPEDLLRAAAEGALLVAGNGQLPRNDEEFASASAEGKGRLHACGEDLAKALELAVESYRRISDWMEDQRGDQHLGAVVQDLDEELAWLLRSGFGWRSGYLRLRRYERYFHGIEDRLGRLKSHPLVRDEEKRGRIGPLWHDWFPRWKEHPEAVRLWDAGWMLEELRLQLFAPGLPRERKVSEKRIEKALVALRGW